MRKFIYLFLLTGISFLFIHSTIDDIWGFFGHRKINRMAVFTLPPEMIGFYKKHIEYITEHAVDPDKRRYATKHEAVRHYIDLDIWGKFPFENVPRTRLGALMKYSDVFVLNSKNDTLKIFGNELLTLENKGFFIFQNKKDSIFIEKKKYRALFYNNVLPQLYEDEWAVACDSFQVYFGEKNIAQDCQKILVVDRFSEHGVLPFHLMTMQKNLTKAFRTGNQNAILRLSADYGHYVGDAHVPLHTTENYNGQLTNQLGIHAFWESRIPELFAEKKYDFFVGKAEYIEDKNDFFWKIILDSHALVDSVLGIEKSLAASFPTDRQFCFEDRNGRTIRTQCKEFAEAYALRMQGMVEQRMTDAIRALGSLWYTAWVDAGQPDLENLEELALSEEEKKELQEADDAFRKGNIKGRAH